MSILRERESDLLYLVFLGVGGCLFRITPRAGMLVRFLCSLKFLSHVNRGDCLDLVFSGRAVVVC